MEQTVLLDLLPKSEIEIYLQILQADGSEKAACINAAALAIANAGLQFQELYRVSSLPCFLSKVYAFLLMSANVSVPAYMSKHHLAYTCILKMVSKLLRSTD